MTDSEALSRLDGGVEEWASWRAGQRDGQIDLAEADLSGRRLDGFDLSGADLRGANLTSCSLVRANLAYTRMENAQLQESNLSNADLSGATLMERCSPVPRWAGPRCTAARRGAPISAAFRATGSRWARSCPPIPGARISPARGSIGRGFRVRSSQVLSSTMPRPGTPRSRRRLSPG